MNISYRELLKATDGFSSANLIGIGQEALIETPSWDTIHRDICTVLVLRAA